MKKFLKIFFIVIFILLLLISLGLNVMFFNGSYGSLAFKYDESLFTSMNSFSYSKVSSDYLKVQKDYGFQLTIEKDNEKIEYIYYVNSESDIYSQKTVTDENENVTNSYSKNTTGYNFVDGVKVPSIIVIDDTNFIPLSSLKLDIIDSKKVKTGLSLNIKYLAGIKARYTDDSNATYNYKFDSKGRIREVTYGNTKVTVTYENIKIIIPD